LSSGELSVRVDVGANALLNRAFRGGAAANGEGDENMPDEDLTGGCLCGDIRYRIDAAPVEAIYCHCQMCRRAHAAPVVAWLTVPRPNFSITSGRPVAYPSSPKASRGFCGRCGTPLTWEAVANPTLVDVAIATLDEPAAVVPSLHVWTGSRIAWFDTADELPRHPTNERS
jgi:hypothetical protein